MWVYSLIAKCQKLHSFPEPIDMYKVATMHTTHKRIRVIQMAKTRVHKNYVQKGKGDREGINQKTFPPQLTVHLSITLSNDQLEAQIFNTFITILYMYMFWAISCSSSGGQIVLIQHLVLSLSVSDCPVQRLRKNSPNLCTGRSLTESDDTRCCINTIWPPEDEQDIARNMYM